MSLQVHEKSILLALLPVSFLALDEQAVGKWLPAFGAFAMFPLLKKDGLGVAYLGVLLIWASITLTTQQSTANGSRDASTDSIRHKRLWSMLMIATQTGALLMGVATHLGQLTVPPPSQYPYLYDLMYVTCGYAAFISAFLYLNVRQWTNPTAKQKQS